MRQKSICIGIALALVFTGCKKEVELPEALVTAKNNLVVVFESLDQQMEAASEHIKSVDLDTALIRAKLADLVEGNEHVAEFSWVNPAGLLQLIEPPTYYANQGLDISHEDDFLLVSQTKAPILSPGFPAAEGFYAAANMHPVLINGTFSGAIEALLNTEEFLGAIMEPLITGQTFELWVMEKGGTMIYDQDAYVVGLNLFTDPLYKDFPDLLTAAEKINDEVSGTTHYSFFRALTNETVTKLAYWTTVEHHGTEWKIVWVKPE